MQKLIAIAILSTATLAGCNTIKGIGQDIEQGGQAVSNTASNVQNKK